MPPDRLPATEPTSYSPSFSLVAFSFAKPVSTFAENALQREDLARIHDVVRVERALDGAHDVERAVAELGARDISSCPGRRRARRCRCRPWRSRGRPAGRGTSCSASTSSASSLSITSSAWKLPSPTWPTIGAIRPSSRDVALGLGDALGEPRDRHADIGRDRPAQPGRSASAAQIGVVARLPELGAVLRLGRPVERAAAELGGDLAEPLRLLRHPRLACRGTRRTASASPAGRAWNSRWRPPTATSSSSSMRATGMPLWMVTIVASQAASIVGNGQMPAEIASGMPCSRSVSSVMMPSVPSEPTKRRVRS